MYLKRNIEKEILEATNEFACITIYGSRQVGKSTVVEHLFDSKFESVSLDDIAIREYALKDPKGFLDYYSTPLIIDEIQKATSLLEEIKIKVDREKKYALNNNRKVKLLFILTGSNQFELQEAISESLAGRTAILNMSSLSFSEIYKYDSSNEFNPDIKELREKEKQYKAKFRSRREIFEDIFKGGMPEYIVNQINRNRFFNSYITTYIEKDVRKVISAKYESTFLNFMQYVALRTAQPVDYTELSRSLGIDARTVKEWISILETSGIIKMLQPYMSNISDRIIKTPKLYFMDTGLCSFLAKIPNPELLEKSTFAGAFYETYVVSEIIKTYCNNSIDYRKKLYYYRDKDQKEVDLIIEAFDGIYPIEIKKGINPVSSNKNFKVLEKYGKHIHKGLVIDSEEKIRPINENVYICPISLIGL